MERSFSCGTRGGSLKGRAAGCSSSSWEGVMVAVVPSSPTAFGLGGGGRRADLVLL